MRKMRLAAMLLAFVTVLAAGCSAIKLGYETLPTWAFFQLDRYWKLDSKQSELVRARLNDFQRWHRHAELPQYAKFLEGVRQRVQGALEPADLARWREAADARWHAAVQHAAPQIADVALVLRSDQIDKMRKRLAEQNADFRKKFLPTDARERLSKRIERAEERAEFFMGKLTEPQREAVRRQVAESSAADDETYYAERLARQQAVVGALERIVATRPAHDEAQRQIEAVLLDLWKPRDAQQTAASDRSDAAADQLTLTLANSATPAQKTKIAQRLQSLQSDVQILMSK